MVRTQEIGSFTLKKAFAFKCEQKKFYFGPASEKKKKKVCIKITYIKIVLEIRFQCWKKKKDKVPFEMNAFIKVGMKSFT